jgi:hypothetical protein
MHHLSSESDDSLGTARAASTPVRPDAHAALRRPRAWTNPKTPRTRLLDHEAADLGQCFGLEAVARTTITRPLTEDETQKRSTISAFGPQRATQVGPPPRQPSRSRRALPRPLDPRRTPAVSDVILRMTSQTTGRGDLCGADIHGLRDHTAATALGPMREGAGSPGRLSHLVQSSRAPTRQRRDRLRRERE